MSVRIRLDFRLRVSEDKKSGCCASRRYSSTNLRLHGGRSSLERRSACVRLPITRPSLRTATIGPGSTGPTAIGSRERAARDDGQGRRRLRRASTRAQRPEPAATTSWCVASVRTSRSKRRAKWAKGNTITPLCAAPWQHPLPTYRRRNDSTAAMHRVTAAPASAVRRNERTNWLDTSRDPGHQQHTVGAPAAVSSRPERQRPRARARSRGRRWGVPPEQARGTAVEDTSYPPNAASSKAASASTWTAVPSTSVPKRSLPAWKQDLPAPSSASTPRTLAQRVGRIQLRRSPRTPAPTTRSKRKH